jgi:eukaryotic-like serine/threonine-protein kinase
MGEVYRARDTRLGREVALKRLSNASLADEVARRRVLREARAAAALSHPGIAAVYDVLDTPDGLIIVMEYLPGATLAARLRNGPFPVEEGVEVGEQIAAALAHAHAQGIVHRDLKPSNIILTPAGRAKILDFGIAKSTAAADADATRDDLETGTGRIVGSPGYMAPEQVAGRPSDRRTDVYAAGLVLFEMLAGMRPYAASDRLSGALAMFNQPVPLLHERAPHVPAEVSGVVACAMALSPSERFADAGELAGALRRVRAHLSNAETVVSSGRARGPRSWQRYSTGPIAISAILLAAAAIVIAWKGRGPAPPVPIRSSVVGVIPIRNLSADKSDDPLAVGLSNALVQRLGAMRAIRVLPLQELREAAGPPSKPKAAPAVAKAVGASFVVEGALQRKGPLLEVDMSLVAADGHRRRVGLYRETAERVLDLHRRIAEGVAVALSQEGAVETDVQAEPLPPTSNQDAFADYSQARVFLDRPDVPDNLDHAIDLLHSAIRRDAKFALAFAALGEACWAQFRETKDPSWTSKAQAANLEALRIDPAQPEVRLALAVMYEGMGKIDEAKEEIRQVLELQPRSDSGHLVLSRIHADKGEWSPAIHEAEEAIALRPAFWRNHVQLGETLMRAGRLDDAIAAYGRLVELQPDSPRGYQRLGRALQAAGRHDEAFANYEKAIAAGASWATFSNVGTSYYWQGDYARAAQAYRRAIAAAPNEPEPYANLGDALQRLGQRERAAESYRRAVQEVRKLLTVKEKDPQALASLALYQAKLGERAAATAAIEEAARLSPADGEVLYVRAIVQALAGDMRGACKYTGAALTNGKSAEEIRRTDELKSMRGCGAYDAVVHAAR